MDMLCYGIGAPTDVWSAGVAMFALLSGRMPFAIADEIGDWRFARVAAAQAEGGSTTATIHGWLEVRCPWSAAAVTLVDSMLAVAPIARPAAARALRSGWLTAHRSRHAVGFGFAGQRRTDGMPSPARAKSPGRPQARPGLAHRTEHGRPRTMAGAEAQEERTCMWRGGDLTRNRTGIA